MNDPDLDSSPLDWNELNGSITYLQGVMFMLVANVNEEAENGVDPVHSYIDRLRAVLSLFALDLDASSDEGLVNQTRKYLTQNLGYDPLAGLSEQFLTKMESLVTNIRANKNVVWYSWSDVLFNESVRNAQKVDFDQPCVVNLYEGKIHVRYTLPSPEIYWQSQNVPNIFYCAHTLYEELTHMMQFRVDKNTFYINALGLEIPLGTSKESYELERTLTARLSEADATFRLLNLMPSVEESQWYIDRQMSPKGDVHHPVPITVTWATAYVIWQIKGLNDVDFYTQSGINVSKIVRYDTAGRGEVFNEDLSVGMIRDCISIVAQNNIESGSEAVRNFYEAFINFCIDEQISNPNFFEEYGSLDGEENKRYMLNAFRKLFQDIEGYKWILELANLDEDDAIRDMLVGLSFEQAIMYISKNRASN